MLREIIAALTAFCCLITSAAAERLVIENVRILNADASAFSAAKTVVVDEGKIAAVAAHKPRPRKDDRVVDGAGRYLIPGLFDMHVHVIGDPDRERLFKLLVANGVTSVRDMNGAAPIAEATALKQEIAAGGVLGPRFWYPGPLIDGPGRTPEALSAQVLEVKTPDEARAAVVKLKGEGADFIKPYNRLTPELHAALIAEANRQGLPVWGHVAHLVSPADASDLGQGSVEHLSNVVEYISSTWTEMHEWMLARRDMLLGLTKPGPEDVQALMAYRRKVAETWDDQRADGLFRKFARNKTWQTPTLTSNRATFFMHRDAGYKSDPRLALYATPSQREEWAKGSFVGAYGGPQADFDKRWELLQRAVNRMAELKVPLLAGTDMGAQYIYAGSSLHDELGLLVAAGLSPAEALAAATTAPAKFLGLKDSGRIAKGKRADLVLLRANPLADIAATREIEAVVLNGRLLDRAALDALLEEGKAAAVAE